MKKNDLKQSINGKLKNKKKLEENNLNLFKNVISGD